MTKKRKASRSSSKRKFARKGAAMASRSARKTDTASFFNPSPRKMENFVSQGKNQFDKLANEANNLGRDGFEAFNKSMSIFAKGCEEIVRASMAIAQSAAEKQTQLIKDAMTSKSINEWADVQNRIAQSNFDDCMAACTKISEMGARVLTQCAEPINNQLNKSMKKAGEAVAA